MPFVIICRCGHRNGYGSIRCVACENKIDFTNRPTNVNRRIGETLNHYAARCGPLIVEEKPERKSNGR